MNSQTYRAKQAMPVGFRFDRAEGGARASALRSELGQNYLHVGKTRQIILKSETVDLEIKPMHALKLVLAERVAET